MNRLDPVAAAVIDLKRVLTQKIEPPDAEILIGMTKDTRKQLEEQHALGVDVSDMKAFLREIGEQYARKLDEELKRTPKPTDELRARAHAAVETARILSADLDSPEIRAA